MDASSPNRNEQPGTYFVEDRANEAELRRITIQDTMITRMMGGVLPEQTDLAGCHRLLDIGCGTGNWLIEVAKTYPTIGMLVGIDVSKPMIDYARMLAEEAGVSERVEFHVMDATRMIEFPQYYFDLVNHRLAWSYLRKWEWPKQLGEYQRVSRLGGIIRITEGDVFGQSNSEAVNQFFKLAREAFFQSGHMFAPGRDGVTYELPSLLKQYGLSDVQSRSVLLEYRPESPYHETFIEDITLALRTTTPFIRKWTKLPDDYETLCKQVLDDMHKPDFAATWEMVTVWGESIRKSDKLPTTEHR